ncbi:TetR/AcrR family transcriptional regulator [uncultured Bacteroides sp.]|uniref:TetR/AcrR family transcriptional regulator n=1 Tax=uncultured Bacteroides sp. TaxID=162156 RepID=UPI00260436E5|nr:TetR/AcrR family transcriptional regulator [uncultured Bacteroides sp.]
MNKDKANMEQKILEAAEKLFMEQGFASTTTAKIAKEAGCNQALVHYYYRTKELLFERIYKEKMQLMVNSITNINTSGSTFEEKVVGVINAHWDFLTKNPLIVWFALRENLNGSTALVNLFMKEIRPKAVDAFSKLEKDLNTEIEKGNISPITIYDLLLTIISLDIAHFVIQPFYQMIVGDGETSVKHILDNRKEEVIKTVLARLKK